MEKANFVKNGVVRLPPGFRFHPTDEELVVQYLKRKVLSYYVPPSIIPQVEVYKSDPWDLPGYSEQERYFFSTREMKYSNGNRSNRATGSGYWKATGLDKQIQGEGIKKTLVFYRGKPPKGQRTDWIMHEYRLLSNVPEAKNITQENWVLCRVFLKKTSNKNMGKRSVPVFYDFMGKDTSASYSSGSSGITDITSSCNCESDNTNVQMVRSQGQFGSSFLEQSELAKTLKLQDWLVK